MEGAGRGRGRGRTVAASSSKPSGDARQGGSSSGGNGSNFGRGRQGRNFTGEKSDVGSVRSRQQGNWRTDDGSSGSDTSSGKRDGVVMNKNWRGSSIAEEMSSSSSSTTSKKGRDSGGGSGIRSTRSGGNGNRPRGNRNTLDFCDSDYSPDPYIQPYNQDQKQIQKEGWNKLEERKENVTLQKYKGKPSSWSQQSVDVSLNHFPVLSIENHRSFPIPSLYHYDISYEMIRKKQGEGSAGTSPVPKKRKEEARRNNHNGSLEMLVNQTTIQLQGSSIAGPESTGATVSNTSHNVAGGGGQKPFNKQLPKYITNMVLTYLIPQIRVKYGHAAIATDGSYNLYSTKRLEEIGFGLVFPMKFDVQYKDLRRVKLLEEDEEATVRVIFMPAIVKETGEIHKISTDDIISYFRQTGSLKGLELSSELRQTLEAACNAYVKSFPNFQYYPVGRSTMVPCNQAGRVKPLGGGLAAWRGVTANISMGWKPYLNVDIANCAFVLNQEVLTVLKEVMNRHCNPEDVRNWRPNDFQDAKSFLHSCKVSYEIVGKRYGGPITDVITRKSVRDATFVWDREDISSEISVFDYYKQRYGKTLKHPNGPVLMIRKKAMVPAELCIIKEGQSYNRKLDGNQTTQMLRFAKRDPHELKSDIEKQIQGMELQKNKVLQELGIQVPGKMLSMKARVLVPPTLRYGPKKNNDSQIAHVSPEGGTWDVWQQQDFSFYQSVKIEKWRVLVLGSNTFTDPKDQFLRKFIYSLKTNGAKKNVNFKNDPRVLINNSCTPYNNPEKNRKVLEELFRYEFKGCQLIVVVIDQKGSSLYGHVKHAAEVDVGVLTQCVTKKTVTESKDATIQNILLKINSKLGGINHVVMKPFDPKLSSQFSTLITDCPLLVLGADVTHAPPGSGRLINGKDFIMPSYAAITGSLDKTCMPFMTEVRAQRKANSGAAEIIQDLDEIVLKMLQNFLKTSGEVPRKIIYFRDGIGDGQFPEVLHIEMTAIRKACKAFRKNYEPKITFITVQKRHKTRIFYHPTPGKTENAPAGTVIDSEIVHPTEVDFYLLSHKGMLGTSRPSRYHVLWDDSNFSKDVLQSLAYTLCYMYIRCTKSVKIPAPTYYAHLAADRAKKLCEGFEEKHGDANNVGNLNRILQRNDNLLKFYPMHFV